MILLNKWDFESRNLHSAFFFSFPNLYSLSTLKAHCFFSCFFFFFFFTFLARRQGYLPQSLSPLDKIVTTWPAIILLLRDVWQAHKTTYTQAWSGHLLSHIVERRKEAGLLWVKSICSRENLYMYACGSKRKELLSSGQALHPVLIDWPIPCVMWRW